MFRDLIINALCLVSIVGGSAATATALHGEKPQAAVVVEAIRPEQFTAWSTAIANSVPVAAAALLLSWSNYRATKRRIEAEDAAAIQSRVAEAKSGEIATIKSERDDLAAKLKDKSE